jgi:hypothetical protein
MKYLFCTLVFSAATLLAGDVTGRWTGTIAMGGDSEAKPALLILKQDGNAVSGTAGPDEGERFPVTNGRVEENRVLLVVAPGEGHGPKEINITLTFDGEDHLVGDARVEEGERKLNAKLDLKRVK